MKKLLFLIFIFSPFLFGGCSLFDEKMDDEKMDDENKIDEGEVLKIRAQDLSFSIFQIVTIDLGETNFSDGKIEGTTLEGVKMPLFVQDNLLTFMVPKLNRGSYKLVFLENSKPFNISFQVKTHELKETPAGYLANYQKKSIDQIEALEKNKSLLSEEKRNVLEKDLAIIKKLFAGQFAKAALLNESDLMDMAYFLEANKDWINELTNSFQKFNSSIPNARISNEEILNVEVVGKIIMENFVTAVAPIVEHSQKIVTLISLGIPDGSEVTGIGDSEGKSTGLDLAIETILLDIQNLFVEIETSANFVRIVGDEAIKSNLKYKYEFENQETYELYVSRNYRTLYSQDENSPVPFVKEYLSSFKNLLIEWDKVRSYSSLELAFSPTNPSTLSTFDSKIFRVHSEHLGVSSISNSRVSNSVEKNNGKLLVNFFTSEWYRQVFKFNINYENVNFGNKVELNEAILITKVVTMIDLRDGNVYRIMKIGTQIWFAENLRYTDSNISHITSAKDWPVVGAVPNTKAAWAYYNNDPSNDSTNGKLYNWYAVQTGILCPQGWHIPTDAEVKVLSNFLVGALAGVKMKATTEWKPPYEDIQNESGFSGLPSGLRNPLDGSFYNQGSNTLFWSSTIGGIGAFGFSLSSGSSALQLENNYAKEHGASCRCLQD
jgi:uncharacterized protein (TIGR02145 family)